MTDQPKPPAPESKGDETPMQKALRLKKESQASGPQAPRGKLGPKGSAAQPAGQSKPWLKK
jgi:hypothetical protein